MKNYTIIDTEAGNIIEQFDTLEEATATLKDYENQDKQEGIFVTDFYQINQIGLIVTSNRQKKTFTIVF